MSTIHVFYFKYPGIQEELVHNEVDDRDYIAPEMVDAPIGAYIYQRGKWWRRHSKQTATVRRAFIGSPAGRVIGHIEMLDHHVPKLIRTLLLIHT